MKRSEALTQCSDDKSKGGEWRIMNNKTTLVIIAIVVVIILVFVTPLIVHKLVHHEIKTVKQETVQEIKKIDRDKAVKAVAGTLHKISAFKKDVKQNLKQLDSADSQDIKK